MTSGTSLGDHMEITDDPFGGDDRITAKAFAYAIAFIDSLPVHKQWGAQRADMLAILRLYAEDESEMARANDPRNGATAKDILNQFAEDIERRSGRRPRF